MAEGAKTAKARLGAKGTQDPDLQKGAVDTSACVSPRPSHFQVLSLRVLRKWEICSPYIENTCFQADGLRREVFLHAPVKWLPSGTNRTWKLRGPTSQLNGASAAFRTTLRRYLLRAEEFDA